MDIEQNIETIESSNEESLGQTIRAAFDRNRDEQGKFAPKEQTEVAEPAQKPVAENVEVAPVEAAPVEAKPEQKAVRPPDSWSPAAKSKFAELPPEIQSEISRREEEVHKGFTKFDEERVLGKQMKDVISPYLPMIRAEGSNEKQAVANLLQTAYTLRTADVNTKTQLFYQLAQQYGVDLGRNPQLQNQFVDPTVQQLQQEIAQLKQFYQGQVSSVEQQEQAQIQNVIDSFASDPKNIYFENVRPDVAALLKEGRAKDLQEAYEMACWARPDIRPLLLQQQEKQRADEQREKANKARSASVSVSGSPVASGSGAPAQTDSLRDQIRQSLRAASGHV